MKRLILILWSLCAVAGWGQTNDLNIYVSPSGNDANPGSKEHPLASLEQAWQRAKDETGKRKVTIYCREGKHRLSAPLVIRPEHSPTAECPLTICAYPGERATVSSARLIDCEWTPAGGGIWKTTVTNADGCLFDGLFVDGVQQTLARYPNRDESVAIFNGFASDAIAPERVKRWKDPRGGYVHAMHAAEWGGFQYTIEGKNEDGTLTLGAGFQNNRLAGMHPEYRMVENVFEELDTIGEWYFDRAAACLYFFPPVGLDLTRARVETPQAEALFLVQGEPGHPVTHVNIEGLELTETVRTFLKTDEPLLRSDWKIYRGGAVCFEHTEHCVLADCHLHHLGGNAVFFSGYTRHGRVERNHIEHIGASAICFVGRPDAVCSPLFEYRQSCEWEEMGHRPGPVTEDYPSLCVADNNLIHSIGETEKQGAGIQLSMAMNITVSHNSIYDLPRAGINISEGTWGGHVIEGNDVFRTVRETGDHGSFNSWGRDRFWHPDRAKMDQRVAEHPESPYLDACNTTIIRNNRWRCDHGWDIDLDDGSTNYHIYNNVCLNGGLKLREGFGRVVENNIILNNSFHPHVWFAASDDVFRHNIVTTGYFPIGITEWGKEVDRNFFVAEEGLLAAQANGTDARSASGDPGFLAAAEGDYRVSSTSPALAVGFENFDMDHFGVQHPPLKALADRPLLPVFRRPEASHMEDADILHWNGLTLKSITTEGERSATGIDAVRGVLVLANTNPDIDLRPNDALLEIDGRRIEQVGTLREIFAAQGSPEPFRVVRFRNQAASVIVVPRPSEGTQR